MHHFAISTPEASDSSAKVSLKSIGTIEFELKFRQETAHAQYQNFASKHADV
jgi:hypothetical protein